MEVVNCQSELSSCGIKGKNSMPSILPSVDIGAAFDGQQPGDSVCPMMRFNRCI
jgi:hypothetical protein